MNICGVLNYQFVIQPFCKALVNINQSFTRLHSEFWGSSFYDLFWSRFFQADLADF